MDDVISRQQAIDAVLNNEHSTDITLMGDAFGKGYTEGYKEEQNNVLQYLADLPSAQPDTYWKEQCQSYEQTINKLRESLSTQPEIIRCKDCKHNPKYEWFGCPMSHLSEKQRPETAWCWKAERRTDERSD